MVGRFRQLIEMVFSQLHGHMHLQKTGAKADMGLIKRELGIVTAFTLGIVLNALLGRPLLAIKELFAYAYSVLCFYRTTGCRILQRFYV